MEGIKGRPRKHPKWETGGGVKDTPFLPNEILERVISYMPQWYRASFACASRYWSQRTWEIPICCRDLEDPWHMCGCDACHNRKSKHNIEWKYEDYVRTGSWLHDIQYQCPCPRCITEKTFQEAFEYAEEHVDFAINTKKKKKEFWDELHAIRDLRDRSALFRYKQILCILDDIDEVSLYFDA